MKKLILIFLLLFSQVFSFDINSASVKDLMQIKSIGKKSAERIVAYRDDNGLDSIDDLINIKGIGKKKLAKIKSQIDNLEKVSSGIDLTKK